MRAPSQSLVERLIREMYWIAGHWRALADAKAAQATTDAQRGYVDGLRFAADDLAERAVELYAALYPSAARPALRLVVDNTSPREESDEIPHRPDR